MAWHISVRLVLDFFEAITLDTIQGELVGRE